MKSIALMAVIFMLMSTAWAGDEYSGSIAASDSAYPKLNLEQSKHPLKQIQHGEYLLKMGDCFTCHTDEANEGKPFAGGLKIDTDFGALYAPMQTGKPILEVHLAVVARHQPNCVLKAIL